MKRTLSAVLLFLVTVTGSQHALATSFTTIFGPGGTAGTAPASSVLNGLDAFTTFSNNLLFFQNGNFYVGGAGPAINNPLSTQGLANLGGPQSNNRAFGFAGAAGSAVIDFNPGIVQEVILQVRGTSAADGFSVGAAGVSLPPGTLLGDANGTLFVFTDAGFQTTIPIPNADYAPLTLQLGGSIAGSSFTQLILSNGSSANSAITLGELTVEAVPEPSTVLLFGSGLAGLALWRLRARSQT